MLAKKCDCKQDRRGPVGVVAPLTATSPALTGACQAATW